MQSLTGKTVLVTGASSGIGLACARAFHGAGARLVVCARRAERLCALADELGRAGGPPVATLAFDVRDRDAVDEAIGGLAGALGEVEVLVNNAGLSRGLESLHQGDMDDWNEMLDTNVRGLLHVDRAVVPGMVARKRGTVIHIGSVSGRQVYPGGAVYCATKHAVRAVTDGLRLDLLGTGVRVGSVDPGMVDTEFSEVRFHGDISRARDVYRGMRPLTADDVAEVVLFAATRPPHVCVADVLLMPTDQASATHVHREPEEESS